MTSAGNRRCRRACGLAGLVLTLLSSACVPWTVVPIEQDQPGAGDAFDAARYVDSIWESRLIPYAREQAKDAATAIGSSLSKAQPFFVTGQGRVVADERSSPNGRLLLDLAPVDGRPDLAILTGPVILGTALRDAVGFIEFSQFTNQLDYAAVANELNDRVVETAMAALPEDDLSGKTVRFLGACSADALGGIEVVPVTLEVAE